MINACISHELRNPLNSIIAQIMWNDSLIQEIERIVKDNTPQKALELIVIKVSELRDSSKVENASANLMKFLVQDFLDYS